MNPDVTSQLSQVAETAIDNAGNKALEAENNKIALGAKSAAATAALAGGVDPLQVAETYGKEIFDLLAKTVSDTSAGENARAEWDKLVKSEENSAKVLMAQALDKVASGAKYLGNINAGKYAARLAVAAALGGPHGLAGSSVGVAMEVAKGAAAQSKRENLLNTAGYLDDIANARAGKTEALQNNPYLAMFAKAPEKVNDPDYNIVAKERDTLTAFFERNLGKNFTDVSKFLVTQGVQTLVDPSNAIVNAGQTVVANLPVALNAVKEIVSSLKPDEVLNLANSFSTILKSQSAGKGAIEQISPKDNLRNHVTIMAKALGIENDEIANQSMQHYGLAKQALSEAAEAIALKAVSEDKEFLDKLKAFYNEKEVNSEKWHKEEQDLTNIFSATKLKVQLEIEKTDTKYKKRNITKTKTSSAEAIASAERIAINTINFLITRQSELKDYSNYNINPETKKDFETKKIFINDGEEKRKEYLEKSLQEDKQGDSYINYQHVENKNKIELNRKIELETTVNPLKDSLKKLQTKKTALETTVNPLKDNLKELETKKTALETTLTPLKDNLNKFQNEEKELEKTLTPLKDNLKKLQPEENSQSAKSTQAKPFAQPKNRDEFIGQVFKSLAEKHAQLKNSGEKNDFYESAKQEIDQIKINGSNKTNSTLRASLKDEEFLKSYFDKLEAANKDGSLNKTSSQIGSAAKIPRRSFLSYFFKKSKESSKQDQGKALKTFLSNAEFINSIAAEAKNLNNGTEKINTLKEEINKKEGEISKTQSEINKTQSGIKKKEEEIIETQSEINKTQSEINKKDEEIKKKYDQELEKAKTDALGRILLNIELNRLAHDENPDKKDILAASKKIKENADPQKENNDDIYRLREAAAVHYSIYQNVELIEEVSKIITSNEGLQGNFVKLVQNYEFPVGKIIGHIDSIGENIDKLKKLETPDHNQIISNLAIINHSITKIGDQIGKDQKTEFNQNTSIHLLAAATELLKNNPDLKKAGDAKNALLKTVNLAHALGETGKKKDDTWEEVKNGAREAIKVDINNNLKKLEAGFNQPTLESLVKNANKLKQIGEKDEFLSKEVAKRLHELSVNHVRINSYDPNVPDKAKLLVAAVRIEKSLESKQAIPQNVLTDGKITLEIRGGGQRLARIIKEAETNGVPAITPLIHDAPNVTPQSPSQSNFKRMTKSFNQLFGL